MISVVTVLLYKFISRINGLHQWILSHETNGANCSCKCIVALTTNTVILVFQIRDMNVTWGTEWHIDLTRSDIRENLTHIQPHTDGRIRARDWITRGYALFYWNCRWNRHVFEYVPVTQFIQVWFQCRPLPSQERTLRNRRFKRNHKRCVYMRADSIALNRINAEISVCESRLLNSSSR